MQKPSYPRLLLYVSRLAEAPLTPPSTSLCCPEDWPLLLDAQDAKHRMLSLAASGRALLQGEGAAGDRPALAPGHQAPFPEPAWVLP